MKTSLSLKTLLRTPLKTLLTFLLLAATSYMLFFSVAEYAAVSREQERATSFYQGVGAAEAESPQIIADDFWANDWWVDYYPLNLRLPVYGLDHYLYTDERVEFNPYGESIEQ